MLRKLTIVVCLISFGPFAVNAQGLTAAVTPLAVAGSATENSVPSTREINLSLAAERSATMLVAAADTTEGLATKATPAEQKKESHSSFNWGNFAEVHLGEYRWIWWVGAAAALAAIHIGAN